MADAGNIFAAADPDPARERFETLLALPGLKIERIVQTVILLKQHAEQQQRRAIVRRCIASDLGDADR